MKKLVLGMAVAAAMVISVDESKAGGFGSLKIPRRIIPTPSPVPPGLAKAYRWMATTKPFPNATTGIKGRIGGVPYEIGMRNATVSDFVIGVASIELPPGVGTVYSKGFKRVWGR